MKPLVEKRHEAAKENAFWPEHLIEVMPQLWPSPIPPGVVRVWRSRRFVVQLYKDTINGYGRLSVIRTAYKADGNLADGIPWDDLQRIKAEVGFGSWWAAEVYPAEGKVVNAANMRHLWLLPMAPPFAWNVSGDSAAEKTENDCGNG